MQAETKYSDLYFHFAHLEIISIQRRPMTFKPIKQDELRNNF